MALVLVSRTSLEGRLLYDSMHALARADQTWQKKEWFRLREPFEALTGLRAEFSSEIARYFFSEEAIEWLHQNCLNAYFFWSVISLATESASSCPITEEDVKSGGAEIAERSLRSYFERSGSDLLCDVETLSHIRDACARGELWQKNEWFCSREPFEVLTTDALLEAGLAAGILMVRSRLPNLMIGRRCDRAQAMDVICNPLCDSMVFNCMAEKS